MNADDTRGRLVDDKRREESRKSFRSPEQVQTETLTEIRNLLKEMRNALVFLVNTKRDELQERRGGQQPRHVERTE
jgi:hypothetical protein